MLDAALLAVQRCRPPQIALWLSIQVRKLLDVNRMVSSNPTVLFSCPHLGFVHVKFFAALEIRSNLLGLPRIP